MAPPIKNIIGKRFGRLVVVSLAPRGRYYGAWWLCKCDCGTEKAISGHNLKSGGTISCGCFQKENNVKKSITHGLSRSRVYRTWTTMVSRCIRPTHGSYPNYGAKGITVCKRWRKFENFYADMGPPPSDKHSLDRIDGRKGYAPGNCRWATNREQGNNRRTNRLITYNGQTLTMAQWADILGADQNTIYMRLANGWDEARAVSTPVRIR